MKANKVTSWGAMLTLLLCLSAGRVEAAPPGSPWGANYFPDVVLVNQDGEALRFYQDLVRDRVVLISFIYGSCRDACPLETAKLRQVQEALGDRVGRDVFLYSITIDPARDTPAALKAYAAKFNAGPGWQFLTGREEDIRLLRRKLGLYRDGEKRGDHSLSLVVGNDATGQWLKRSSFDHPKVLAAVLGEQLFNHGAAQPDRKSYAAAPRLARPDAGEDLFRRRCQACHALGTGNGTGPDLLGVTERRDRAWLARWIKEPDRMLAEQDPLALALYAQYNELPMPNLRLSDREVESLIGYLEAESLRMGRAARAGTGSGAAPVHR